MPLKSKASNLEKSKSSPAVSVKAASTLSTPSPSAKATTQSKTLAATLSGSSKESFVRKDTSGPEEGDGDTGSENEDSGNSDEENEAGSEDESDSEDDEGVDDKGMERLMKLLGEDGLDDFARAELGALTADDEADGEEDESKSEADEKTEDEDEDEDEDVNIAEQEIHHSRSLDGEVNGQEVEREINLEDAESVDDDVILKQKVEIDNKVSVSIVSVESAVFDFNYADCTRANTRYYKTRPVNALDGDPHSDLSRNY